MNARCWLCAFALAAAGACSKHEVAGAADPSARRVATSAPSAAACGHAACGESYFIDAAARDGCKAVSRCDVSLKLVATGAFHINDQYPYRFKAESTPSVEFLGTDPAGKNVFSKPAGDWAKSDPKSGVMTVRLTPTSQGDATITGVFKLSVCSEQNCLIEQPKVQLAIHSS